MGSTPIAGTIILMEANMNGFVTPQFLILIVFILGIYFFLIRPQKKKEKAINEMRRSIQVGDEIITIGGICGKVVKAKGEDDNIVIQVGSERIKLEMTRWSVSSVVNPATRKVKNEEFKEANKPNKAKRLKKADEAAEQPVAEDKPVDDAAVATESQGAETDENKFV